MMMNLIPRWIGKDQMLMRQIMGYLKLGYKLVYLNKSGMWGLIGQNHNHK